MRTHQLWIAALVLLASSSAGSNQSGACSMVTLPPVLFFKFFFTVFFFGRSQFDYRCSTGGLVIDQGAVWEDWWSPSPPPSFPVRV